MKKLTQKKLEKMQYSQIVVKLFMRMSIKTYFSVIRFFTGDSAYNKSAAAIMTKVRRIANSEEIQNELAIPKPVYLGADLTVGEAVRYASTLLKRSNDPDAISVIEDLLIGPFAVLKERNLFKWPPV